MKKIIWLEDTNSTIDRAYDRIKKKVDIILCSSITQFADDLYDYKDELSLIILDIMLIGVNTLSEINMENVTTEQGYNAGWKIISHFIRTDNSPFIMIPILVVTVTSITYDYRKMMEDLTEKGGVIDFVEKNKRGWSDVFEKKVLEMIR